MKSGIVAMMIEAKLPETYCTPPVSHMLYRNGSVNAKSRKYLICSLRIGCSLPEAHNSGIAKRVAISIRPVRMIVGDIAGSERNNPLVKINDAPHKADEKIISTCGKYFFNTLILSL